MKNKENKNFGVLLVDDDEFLLDMYASKFRIAGFRVEVAHDGEEALSKLRGGVLVDIILLDIVMPKMSGFEFLEALRKEKLPGMPLVVVLSNLGQKEEIEKSKKMGVDDYVVKANFTPSEVVEKVKTFLSKQNHEK